MSFSGSDFDDLLRPREVAELLGVRASTVGRWAREGLIKPFTSTPGGHRRFRRGEVLALRESNSTDARSVEERRMEEDAARLYVQGWTIRRVAAEFDCGYGKMRRILAKQVVLRNRGGRMPGTFDS